MDTARYADLIRSQQDWQEIQGIKRALKVRIDDSSGRVTAGKGGWEGEPKEEGGMKGRSGGPGSIYSGDLERSGRAEAWASQSAVTRDGQLRRPGKTGRRGVGQPYQERRGWGGCADRPLWAWQECGRPTGWAPCQARRRRWRVQLIFSLFWQWDRPRPGFVFLVGKAPAP